MLSNQYSYQTFVSFFDGLVESFVMNKRVIDKVEISAIADFSFPETAVMDENAVKVITAKKYIH